MKWEELENAPIGFYNVWIDYFNNESVNEQGILKVDPNARWVSLIGEAVDTEAYGSLKALYIKAGDNIVSCNYGVDRQSVVDYLGERYRHSGFYTQFNSELLYDSDGNLLNSISFILVGNDGTYMYEPVQIILEY